jgi:hypothetical protein
MPLKIMPHGRLQEWVAEEKGFFTAEGLDYTFLTDSGDYGIHSVQRDDAGEVRTGAFETFGAGRDGADVSCACHWATNAAAGERSGQLVTEAYSVAPCAIVVPPESPVRRPEDLAGLIPNGPGDRPRYLTLIRVPCSAPSQISRITPAAATSNTCMVRDCSLASTNALVSMMRTPAVSASS